VFIFVTFARRVSQVTPHITELALFGLKVIVIKSCFLEFLLLEVTGDRNERIFGGKFLSKIALKINSGNIPVKLINILPQSGQLIDF